MTVAPVPRPIELVEIDRTWPECADIFGIGGRGGGVWAENAQNRFGDLGGGGGDLGRAGARGVSEPNDEVEDLSPGVLFGFCVKEWSWAGVKD